VDGSLFVSILQRDRAIGFCTIRGEFFVQAALSFLLGGRPPRVVIGASSTCSPFWPPLGRQKPFSEGPIAMKKVCPVRREKNKQGKRDPFWFCGGGGKSGGRDGAALSFNFGVFRLGGEIFNNRVPSREGGGCKGRGRCFFQHFVFLF